ncbi:MAG TPA: hypothetical protein VHZ74_25705 [Bryobacteraceae bacterium]|nr:hypothetical protein [Bryobacteraceae bacterium]
MKSATFLFAAVSLASCLAGCSKNIDTPEAVKAGVIKDIAKKVDVASMDVNVDSVSFREKEADAKVSFRPRGADPSQSITMTYSLERQGDEWHIKSRNMEMHQQGQGGTTGAGPLPAGHPGIPEGVAPSDGQLPAGHPHVDAGHADPTRKP